MFWTAAQYAAHEGIPLRTARWRLARWLATGAVRVIVERIASDGHAPPRTRLLLDVASWLAGTTLQT